MKPKEDADDVFAALEKRDSRKDFESAASELGLSRRHTHEGDGEKRAYEEVWAAPGDRSAVHYVEDPLTGVTFVRVRGQGKRTLLSDLAMRIDLLGAEDVIEAAVDAETHDDRVRAIFRVAVVVPKVRQDVLEIFQGYVTEDSDPVLRRATLNAMAYRCWPELAELIAQVASSDEDAEVRQTAARLLPYFKAEDPPSG